MDEQDRIELIFTRSRFLCLIGVAIVTGCGLMAGGMFAGMEMGAAKARASATKMPVQMPLPVSPAIPIAPVSNVPVAEVAEATSQPSPGEHFVVQAGSFRSAREAERLVAELLRKGYPVETVTWVDRDGMNWLVVRAGPYDARDAAEQAARDLGPLAGSVPVIRAIAN